MKMTLEDQFAHDTRRYKCGKVQMGNHLLESKKSPCEATTL
jgi:hypothetical protein